MQNKTRQLIQEIKSKVKSTVTTQREFHSDDAVIDLAVLRLHQDLKSKGVLWAPLTCPYGTSSVSQDPRGTLWMLGPMSRHWTMQMSLIFQMMTGISFISALHWMSSWCRILIKKRCRRHRCGGLIMSFICTGPILDLSQSPLAESRQSCYISFMRWMLLQG